MINQNTQVTIVWATDKLVLHSVFMILLLLNPCNGPLLIFAMSTLNIYSVIQHILYPSQIYNTSRCDKQVITLWQKH